MARDLSASVNRQDIPLHVAAASPTTTAMYALKIEVDRERGDASCLATTSGEDRGADVEEIQVSAGNPRVEHLTGIVHLYRQTRGREEAEGTSGPALPVCPGCMNATGEDRLV